MIEKCTSMNLGAFRNYERRSPIIEINGEGWKYQINRVSSKTQKEERSKWLIIRAEKIFKGKESFTRKNISWCPVSLEESQIKGEMWMEYINEFQSFHPITKQI